jgi:hypothetical protein
MESPSSLVKILLITGGSIIAIAIIIWLAGDKLSWFGKLPGDIRIKNDNFGFYFPITTMIIVSIVASLIIWIIKKL